MTAPNRRLHGAAVPVALLAAIALGSGCTSTSTAGTSAGAAPATTTTVLGASQPAATGAATLRAKLTSLLAADAYLSAVVTSVVVSGGDPTPAAEVVNANTAAAAGVFGAVYGEDLGTKFSAVWGRKIVLLVDYARAKIHKDGPGVDAAKAELDGYRNDVGAFAGGLTVNLTKQAVVDELAPGVAAQLDLVDSQVAHSPVQYAAAVSAAGDTQHTAALLAGAMAKQFPDKFPGTATGTAANLRASLTSVMAGHVFLGAITTATALGGGDVAPAASALDTNSHALANAISVVFGDAAGRQFFRIWEHHAATLLDYAKATSPPDSAAQAKARSVLDSDRAAMAALLATASPKLAQSEVADRLGAIVTSQLVLIDAQAGASPRQFALLRSSADTTPAFALMLSEAIAEQFPARFKP